MRQRAALKNFAAWSGLLLLAACTSTTEILQGYIGRPVSDVVVEFGMPSGAFDVGDGRRAFLWSRINTFTTPGYARTTVMRHPASRDPARPRHADIWTYTTTIEPPETYSTTCNYVIYAERANNQLEGPAGWTVTGFEEPPAGC